MSMETAHVAYSELIRFAELSSLASQIFLCEGPHDSMDVVAPFTGSVLGTVPVAREFSCDLTTCYYSAMKGFST